MRCSKSIFWGIGDVLMNSFIVVVIPTCISTIIVPIILRRIVKSYFMGLASKSMITDWEHFAVKYPPIVRHLFICITLFWFALLLFFWESRTSSAWAYTGLCAFFLLSLFFLYYTWKWKVIVSGKKPASFSASCRSS